MANEQQKSHQSPTPKIQAIHESSQLYANFKPGDLLYGISFYRDPLILALDRKFACENNQVTQNGYFLTPDRLNNFIFNSDTNHTENPVITSFISHLKSLQKNPFNLDKNYDVEKKKLKYGKHGLMIRRSCKGAITWPSRTIHFCLDGVIPLRILNKFNDEKGAKDYSYTISELRWLYKNKDKLSNKVIFYINGNQCPAPWEGNEAEWEKLFKTKFTYEHDLLLSEHNKKLSANVGISATKLANPTKTPSKRKLSLSSQSTYSNTATANLTDTACNNLNHSQRFFTSSSRPSLSHILLDSGQATDELPPSKRRKLFESPANDTKNEEETSSNEEKSTSLEMPS